MAASHWEYRFRFWILTFFFLFAFALRRGPHLADAVAGIFDLDYATAKRVVFAGAATSAAIAAWLRTWGAAYLGAEVVHDEAVRSSDVVADGPYRHVRNPLYLANLIFAAGIGACATLTGWWVLVLAWVLFTVRLIAREERTLVDGQGEAYLAYCAAVPNRLWPALRPLVARRAAVPGWGEAALGELFVWGCAAACVVGAVTLRAGVASAIAGASFVVGVAVTKVMEARAAREAAHEEEAAASEAASGPAET